MSLMELANYFSVRPGTAQSWESGRRIPPDEVLTEMSNIYLRIDAAAKGQAQMNANMPPGVLAAVQRRRLELSITAIAQMAATKK